MLAHRTSVVTCEHAIAELGDLLGPLSEEVQRIRFIDYVHEGTQSFRYTIALIWTNSEPSARERIYNIADEFVVRTGWYPLPQGERIGSRQSDRDFSSMSLKQAKALSRLSIGRTILGVESAVDPSGGCALRCRTDKSDLLFDTGLPGHYVPRDTDALVLISHSHMDHVGGLENAISRGIPAVMSRATARILKALGRLNDKSLRVGCHLIDPWEVVEIGDALKISAFLVPHCPGSVGYTVSDGARTVIYSGDAAFATARLDFIPTLETICKASGANQRLILLDATMAGRDQGASGENVAKLALGLFERFDDIVLVANDVEQLLYAYLDLFFVAKSSDDLRAQVEFFATLGLREVFRILHSAFISRDLDSLDPFIFSQYGSSMSSWAESRWLYWIDKDSLVSNDLKYRRIWLVCADETGKVVCRGRTCFIRIGRAAEMTTSEGGVENTELDCSAWTLHSDETALVRTIQNLKACGEIALFHNFPKRLRKFARDHGVESKVIDSKGINF